MKRIYPITGIALAVALMGAGCAPEKPSPLQESVDSLGQTSSTVAYVPGVFGSKINYVEKTMCTRDPKDGFMWKDQYGEKGAKPCYNIGIGIDAAGGTTLQRSAYVRVWSASSTEEIAMEIRKAVNARYQEYLIEKADEDANEKVRDQLQNAVR